MKAIANMKTRYADYKALGSKDKLRFWGDFFLNNAIYFLLVFAIIYVQSQNDRFLATPSIVNILKLAAADIPIACGIAGCIVLTGTDLSAGRVVGLTACISASFLGAAGFGTKLFGAGWNNIPVEVAILLVFLAVLLVGTFIGAFNGFFVAYFNLHPFIVTLATQLMVYGTLIMYLQMYGNEGQPLSGVNDTFKELITGSIFTIDGARIPNYVLYAVIVIAIMWFVWNKTTFGKNMFAVGSNPEAANVSGVNVKKTIIMVHALAGAMYAVSGFINSARIGSNTADTGANFECDAIAACVIGGVSFVGGTGKIRGVVLGVFILRIIFAALTFLEIDASLQSVIKGIIILFTCVIDMRKYMVKK